MKARPKKKPFRISFEAFTKLFCYLKTLSTLVGVIDVFFLHKTNVEGLTEHFFYSSVGKRKKQDLENCDKKTVKWAAMFRGS